MNEEFCLFQINGKRVIWEVTKYCNYQCKHCCASASMLDTKNELSTKECMRVLKELKEFGVKEIYFSGGEPFSRKDMLLILEKAREYGIVCNVSTNGSFLTKNMATKLATLNLNKVHISLDSHLKKDFNEFRGGEYFEPTVQAIQLLKKHHLYVRVGTVIWKKNVLQLRNMVEYLVSLGVDEVVFNWLVKVGRLKENDNVCVPLSEFDDTIAEIQDLMDEYQGKIKISMHRHEKFCDSQSICPAGEKFFYIDPQGFVSPCSWIKKMDTSFTPSQSLREFTFSEIIEGDEMKNFNRMKKARQKEYHAGCPAICKERNHTYFSEDPLLEKSKEESVNESIKCLSFSFKR